MGAREDEGMGGGVMPDAARAASIDERREPPERSPATRGRR